MALLKFDFGTVESFATTAEKSLSRREFPLFSGIFTRKHRGMNLAPLPVSGLTAEGDS